MACLGPNELTMCALNVLPVALVGPSNTLNRSAWYELVQPYSSHCSIRNSDKRGTTRFIR